MSILSHIHRLLCKHCRQAKPIECHRCQKKAEAAEKEAAQQKETPRRTRSPRSVRRDQRAVRLALYRAKADLERELAAGTHSGSVNYADDEKQRLKKLFLSAEAIRAAAAEVAAAEAAAAAAAEKPLPPTPKTTTRHHRVVPRAELPGAQCKKTDAAAAGPYELPADVPSTRTQIIPPPPDHRRSSPLDKMRAYSYGNLRLLARKSFGSPARAAQNSSDNIIDNDNDNDPPDSVLDIGTATVQRLTRATTMARLVCIRRGVHGVHRAPSCLAVGRRHITHNSNSGSSSSHDISLVPPPLAIPYPSLPAPKRTTPPSSSSPRMLSPPAQTRSWARYEAFSARSTPTSQSKPPEPRSWAEYAAQTATPDAPADRPPMPLPLPLPLPLPSPRRPSTAPLSAKSLRELLLPKMVKETTAPPIHYSSGEGRRRLQALRRLLGVPAGWPAGRLLVFVLRHPRTRGLASPDKVVQQANGVAWTGIDREMPCASYAEKVLRWLACREALFTGRTPAYAHLLRRRGANKKPSPPTDMIYFPWAIQNSRRPHYHQLWTRPGRSRLAESMLAE